MKHLTIRLPESLYAEVKARAARVGEAPSVLIRALIRRGLECEDRAAPAAARETSESAS